MESLSSGKAVKSDMLYKISLCSSLALRSKFPIMRPQWKIGLLIIEVSYKSRGKLAAGPLTGGDCGFWARKLDDSPGLEVLALFRGGALLDGCGCGGDIGVGLTNMSCLRGVGAAGAPWIATALAAEAARPTAGAAEGSGPEGQQEVARRQEDHQEAGRHRQEKGRKAAHEACG